MKAARILGLFAGSVRALAQENDHFPAVEVPRDIANALDIDPTLFGKSVFSITEDVAKRGEDDGAILEHAFGSFQKRQNPMKYRLSSAEEVGKLPDPFGGKRGIFFRGDSRPPSEIFRDGFVPKGKNTNLVRHLSFEGPSGLVSLSKSIFSAGRYAFGRPADGNQKGYIYVIAHSGVPRGFWVPGIYPPEKNPAVHRNQEFAVAGTVPGSSISHAYEVKLGFTFPDAVKRFKNPEYDLAHPGCLWNRRKRSECSPSTWKPEEEFPNAKAVVEAEQTLKGKGRPAGTPITENVFLRFLAETDVEFLRPLIDSIKSGECSAGDYHMALKRAMSETIDKRYTHFDGADETAASIAHMTLDIMSAARFGIPRGFWEDVVRNLPPIARKISKAKTTEEKLKIANTNINAVMRAWERTPVGTINEVLMGQSPRLLITTPVKNLIQLWSYTPLGLVIGLFAPADDLLKKLNVRDDFLKFGLIH